MARGAGEAAAEGQLVRNGGGRGMRRRKRKRKRAAGAHGSAWGRGKARSLFRRRTSAPSVRGFVALFLSFPSQEEALGFAQSPRVPCPG